MQTTWRLISDENTLVFTSWQYKGLSIKVNVKSECFYPTLCKTLFANNRSVEV